MKDIDELKRQGGAFGRSAGSPAIACYLTHDMVGTPRLITDQNQNVVARHDFIPFGEEIQNGVADRNGSFGFASNVTQAFTGQESDCGTVQLDYFNARHLSAVLGGFVQPDPGSAGADIANPQSWNAYAYVLGNPLGMVDPSGKDTQCGPGRYFTGEGCSGPPSGLTEGENNYVNVTVIPGYLSGVNSRYPNPIFTPFPSGATSATITFGDALAQQTATLSALSVSGADDPPVRLDIWKGQQSLWSNTAGVGNTLTAATAAVVAAPVAVETAGSLSVARLAVGPGQPYGIHFAVGVGGTWLHWVGEELDDFGNFSSVITTRAAEARATKLAWFRIPLPVVNPAGVVGTVGQPASNCLTAACYALGQGWIP